MGSLFASPFEAALIISSHYKLPWGRLCRETLGNGRLKFFVPPAVPQNILFFLLEETDPSASVIVLAAVHPKVGAPHKDS